MATQITTPQKGLYPDSVFNYAEAVPGSLVLNPAVATVAGQVAGDEPQLRVPYIKTEFVAGFTPEGEEISDGGGELDEVLVNTAKVATIVTQSNESATFQTASQLIAAGVSRSLVTKADSAFLLNAKAEEGQPQLGSVGLLNLDGLTSIEDVAFANLVDEIAQSKATVEALGGTPTAILTSPALSARLRTLKSTDGGTYVLGSPTESGQLSIFSLPVVVSRFVPDDTLVIVSASELVAAVGDVKLAVSTDAKFTSDSIVRRATWRIGFNLVHADRIVKLVVAGEPEPQASSRASK